MSAVWIVIPGGLSSIAVRNAERLYEPARRLPQMARTLIPFASLIRLSPLLAGDPLSHPWDAGKAVPHVPTGTPRKGASSGTLCCGTVAFKHLTMRPEARRGR